MRYFAISVKDTFFQGYAVHTKNIRKDITNAVYNRFTVMARLHIYKLASYKYPVVGCETRTSISDIASITICLINGHFTSL